MHSKRFTVTRRWRTHLAALSFLPSILSAARLIRSRLRISPFYPRSEAEALNVGLAAAAAPAFFPHAKIDQGSAYADGGLWANNPAIVGYIEAMKIRAVCCRPNLDQKFDVEDVFMLSVGTGEPQYYAKPGPLDDGLLWWGPRLFDVAGGAQSQGAHFQAQYLMGDRYTRVDFKMPAQPWQLDDVSALPDLLHYGTQAAIEHYPQLQRSMFKSKKPTYHPFNGALGE